MKLKKNNSFLSFLKYFDAQELNGTIKKTKTELNEWLNQSNDWLYNSLDCEKLIYLEIKYEDNLEIQELIALLKKKIAYHYENRQRLISKLSLNREILDEQ